MIFSYKSKQFLILPLILLSVLIFITGCGPDYEEGETTAELIVSHRNINFNRGPVVLPVQPGEKLELQARVTPPDSAKYNLVRRRKKWIMDGDIIGRGETVAIEAPQHSEKIYQVSRSYWKVDDFIGSSYLTENAGREINLAVAREKKPGAATVNGYPVGYFPDVSGRYSRWRDKLVNLKNEAPYYRSPEDDSPGGKLLHGTPLELPEVDSLTVENNRVQVIYEGEQIWIEEGAVSIPYSVQVFSHVYEEPRWYYPVTEENKDAEVLPGLLWKQFSHDRYYREEILPEYPHYIPLDRRLITELNELRKKLVRAGYPSRIKLLCGARNPEYNLGEATEGESLKALYSRHQFGDAVDLIIDSTRDGRMDDLNADGRRTIEDARVVAEIAEEIREERGWKGGIGIYSDHDVKNRVSSPYVHLDLRGLEARWEIE